MASQDTTKYIGNSVAELRTFLRINNIADNITDAIIRGYEKPYDTDANRIYVNASVAATLAGKAGKMSKQQTDALTHTQPKYQQARKGQNDSASGKHPSTGDRQTEDDNLRVEIIKNLILYYDAWASSDMKKETYKCGSDYIGFLEVLHTLKGRSKMYVHPEHRNIFYSYLPSIDIEFFSNNYSEMNIKSLIEISTMIMKCGHYSETESIQENTIDTSEWFDTDGDVKDKSAYKKYIRQKYIMPGKVDSYPSQFVIDMCYYYRLYLLLTTINPPALELINEEVKIVRRMFKHPWSGERIIRAKKIYNYYLLKAEITENDENIERTNQHLQEREAVEVVEAAEDTTTTSTSPDNGSSTTTPSSQKKNARLPTAVYDYYLYTAITKNNADLYIENVLNLGAHIGAKYSDIINVDNSTELCVKASLLAIYKIHAVSIRTQVFELLSTKNEKFRIEVVPNYVQFLKVNFTHGDDIEHKVIISDCFERCNILYKIQALSPNCTVLLANNNMNMSLKYNSPKSVNTRFLVNELEYLINCTKVDLKDEYQSVIVKDKKGKLGKAIMMKLKEDYGKAITVGNIVEYLRRYLNIDADQRIRKIIDYIGEIDLGEIDVHQLYDKLNKIAIIVEITKPLE